MNRKHDNAEVPLTLVEENEIRKARLAAQFGSVFPEPEEELSPEMESCLLNFIEELEEKRTLAKKEKIYDLIGNPSYQKPELIHDEKLQEELKRIRRILASKNILLHTSGSISPKREYLFITRELFFFEILVMPVPGAIHNFVLEENTEDEIAALESIHWFFKCLEEKEYDCASTYIHPDFYRLNGKIVPKGNFVEYLSKWLQGYGDFSFKNIEIEDVDNDTPSVSIIPFSFVIFPEKEKRKLKVKARFILQDEEGFWMIKNATFRMEEMPGD